MTIQAQHPDRAQTDSPQHDHPTRGMNAKHPFLVDSFAVLDHRTRARLIPEAGAPAGRYLSLEHDGENLLIALERPITHIGRGLVADIHLDDAHVSRRHAIVALRGEGARVLDDRSYNGTFVNGRRVTVAHLADGDVVRFGRSVFRYLDVAPRREPDPLRRIPIARRAPRREPAGAAA